MRPEDYVPPGARTWVEPPPPTRWERVREPVVATAAVSAGVLAWVLAVRVRGALPAQGLLAGVLVAFGLVRALRPAWGFAFGSRWQFRDDPQPSDAALFWGRVGGVVLLLVGIALVVVLLPDPAAVPQDDPGFVDPDVVGP